MALATTAFCHAGLSLATALWYAGIEGGLMIVEDYNLDYNDGVRNISDGVDIGAQQGHVTSTSSPAAISGGFRAEAEIAYKRAFDRRDRGDPTNWSTRSCLAVSSTPTAAALPPQAMIDRLFDFGDDDSCVGLRRRRPWLRPRQV